MSSNTSCNKSPDSSSLPPSDNNQLQSSDHSRSPLSDHSRSPPSDHSRTPLSNLSSFDSSPFSYHGSSPIYSNPTLPHDGSPSPDQDQSSSPIQDRNPSPPPEILRNNEVLLPDKIGNSVYSKHWLYKTLMSITKVYAKSDVILNSETASGANEIEELDPKIEEDACTLWDMSANNEVASFLYECGIVDIFVEAVDKTKSPRLLEIMIGILANMCAFDSTCENISKSKTLLYNIILLSGTSDSPSLLQVFRIIKCGIGNFFSREFWLEALKENLFFMENLKFTLENNLNGEVLKSAIEVLDRILTEHSSYCYMWGHQPYALAVITAADQLMKDEAWEALDQFFYLMNTLFHHVPNVKSYADNFDLLQPLFIAYFKMLIREDIPPKASRLLSITRCFSVYGDILESNDLKKDVLFDPDAMNSIYKLALCAKNKLTGNLSRILVDQNDGEKADEEKVYEVPCVSEAVENEYWAVLLEYIKFGISAMSLYAKNKTEEEMITKIVSISFDGA